MSCPYLAKDIIYFCVSEFQSAIICGNRIRKYCKLEAHRDCPRFRGAEKAACEGAFL